MKDNHFLYRKAHKIENASHPTPPPPPSTPISTKTKTLTGDGLSSAWTEEYSQESTWSPTLENKNYKISSIEMAELKDQINKLGSNVVRVKATIAVLEEDNMMETENES